MFVSTNRCIIKTCGTTTLLLAVKPLIELVQTSIPGAVVQVRAMTLALTGHPLLLLVLIPLLLLHHFPTGCFLFSQDVQTAHSSNASPHKPKK